MKKLTYILFGLAAALFLVALYATLTSLHIGPHTLYYVFLGIVTAAVTFTIVRIAPGSGKGHRHNPAQ